MLFHRPLSDTFDILVFPSVSLRDPQLTYTAEFAEGNAFFGLCIYSPERNPIYIIERNRRTAVLAKGGYLDTSHSDILRVPYEESVDRRSSKHSRLRVIFLPLGDLAERFGPGAAASKTQSNII